MIHLSWEKWLWFPFSIHIEGSESILLAIVNVMDIVFRTSENGFRTKFLASFERKYMQQIKV